MSKILPFVILALWLGWVGVVVEVAVLWLWSSIPTATFVGVMCVAPIAIAGAIAQYKEKHDRPLLPGQQ